MNYLTLCQVTAQECLGDSTSLTAVTGQTGELKRIVDWVAQAWTEIQNRHPDWRWLRSTFTLDTVASDGTYEYGDAVDEVTTVAITRFSSWHLDDPWDPPKIYLQSAGQATETWLTYTPWDAWKTVWLLGANRTTTGYPAHIAVDPADQLRVGPLPNAVYVITGDYIKSAQTLAANSDTPEMPSQFHQLIVYRAMEKYGLADSAGEVLASAQSQGNRLMRQLENNQLPAMRLAAPMA